jgi:hypothetical protein
VALAPIHAFMSVEATNAAAFCRLDRLPVHDDHRGTRRPADLPASLLIDCALQASPHTGVLPDAEIVIHGTPGWKLPGKKAPLAAGAQQIENRVDHSTNIGCARPAAGLCCRQKWGEQCPYCVAHVRGIVIVWHSRSFTEATLIPCKVI